jgi:hypothetical protein
MWFFSKFQVAFSCLFGDERPIIPNNTAILLEMGGKAVLLCDQSYMTACVPLKRTPKGWRTNRGPTCSVGTGGRVEDGPRLIISSRIRTIRAIGASEDEGTRWQVAYHPI